jgi:hypothetical protein
MTITVIMIIAVTITIAIVVVTIVEVKHYKSPLYMYDNLPYKLTNRSCLNCSNDFVVLIVGLKFEK